MRRLCRVIFALIIGGWRLAVGTTGFFRVTGGRTLLAAIFGCDNKANGGGGGGGCGTFVSRATKFP